MHPSITSSVQYWLNSEVLGEGNIHPEQIIGCRTSNPSSGGYISIGLDDRTVCLYDFRVTHCVSLDRRHSRRCVGVYPEVNPECAPLCVIGGTMSSASTPSLSIVIGIRNSKIIDNLSES